ncbi:MAG: hypothetical protein V3W18_10590 [candidate division Zixibacteria bacterium]
MDYLFQFSIKSGLNGIYEFTYKNLRVKLLLIDSLIYTKSKKLQVVVSGPNYRIAEKQLYSQFHEFYDLLIYFTKESIEVGVLELILKSERGKLKRTMAFNIIDIRNNIEIPALYLGHLNNFLECNIEEFDLKIIYYLRRAIEAQHIYDKYFHIFKAIEVFINYDTGEFKNCPKCKSTLICKECKSKIPFNRLTPRNLQAALEKITSFNVSNYDFKTIIDYRHWCAHSVDKGKIDITKAGEIAFDLFLKLDNYLRHKYNIEFMMNNMGQAQGTQTGFYRTKYDTDKPEDDFAFDVLSRDDVETIVPTEPADLDSF